MLLKRSTTVFLPCLALLGVSAAGTPSTPPAKRLDLFPSVQLDNGTFVGISDGTVDKYLGIPYVKPPYVSMPHVIHLWLTRRFALFDSTGDLRFRLPVPNDAYNGTQKVIAYGPSCPQLSSSLTPNISKLPLTTILFVLTKWNRAVNTTDEDCECMAVHVLLVIGVLSLSNPKV